MKRLLIIFASFLMLFASPFLSGVARAYTSVSVTDYSLPDSGTVSAITQGPAADGDIWFGEQGSSGLQDYIGKITPTGEITTYSLGQNWDPQGIAAGPDGAVWFTETNGGKIGRIDTSGDITTYTIPNVDGRNFPYGITAGPEDDLWFSDQTSGGVGYIGQVSTSGSFTMHATSGAYPSSVASGSDGAIWFVDTSNDDIDRMTTAGALTDYSMSSVGSDPSYIVAGADGALWFAEEQGNEIGRITTAGAVTGYPLPSGSVEGETNPLTAGPDGQIWFGQGGYGLVTSLSMGGDFTEYANSSSATAAGLVAFGADNTVWFSFGGTGSDEIGHFAPPVTSAPTDLTAASPTSTAPALSWDAVTGAVSYNIYRNGIDIGSSSTASYKDSSAPQGDNSYYVTAVNGGGESGNSNTVNVAYDSTIPGITYFTANNGSTFSRLSSPFMSGVSTQTINSDGSVTVSVNSAPGYADSGFYLYEGPLGDLPNFTVNGTGADYGLNLWFDNEGLGDFFQWNSDGVMTSLDGDTYGLSSGSTGGTLAVNGSSSFFMMDDAESYTLSQLVAGDDSTSGINADTPVAVWVGVDVGSGGSTSATINSISGL